MKKVIGFLWAALCASVLYAQPQPLTLEACQQLAQELSPLQQQRVLYEAMTDLQETNLKKAWLPQFALNGQVSYQSDVFTFPGSLPGAEFPEIPKTQFRLALDVSQPIYEGGAIKTQRQLARQEQSIRNQEIKTSVFPIREAITQLYFGILVLDTRGQILVASKKTLEEQLKVINSLIENGAMLSSAADAFRVQMLTLDQQVDQVRSDRKAMADMMADWLGVDSIGKLEMPEKEEDRVAGIALDRPEHRLFALQKEKFELEKDLLQASVMPKVSAFATGGIGSPNPMNFLDTDVSPYYMVGLRLNWAPWDWKNRSRKREMLNIQQKLMDTQSQNLDRNVNIQLVRDLEKADLTPTLVEKDDEIIALQKKVVRQSEAQMKSGVITSTDYLKEYNALTQYQLTREVHRIQGLQAWFSALTQAGNIGNP